MTAILTTTAISSLIMFVLFFALPAIDQKQLRQAKPSGSRQQPANIRKLRSNEHATS